MSWPLIFCFGVPWCFGPWMTAVTSKISQGQLWGQRLSHHPSIPLPSLLSSLASLLFPQNHFSCMLALCSPYIAKSELLSPPAYPFCLLSEPSVNHTCSLAGQSYSGWHFCELLSLLMFLKFSSLLFLAQKSSSYYFNSTWQISIPSFNKANISSLEKGWFLFHPIHQLLF